MTQTSRIRPRLSFGTGRGRQHCFEAFAGELLAIPPQAYALNHKDDNVIIVQSRLRWQEATIPPSSFRGRN